MKPQTAKRLHGFTICIRIVLGLVFLYSSISKIADPSSFAAIVANYRLLPEWLVWATAVFLPWMEAICAMALLCGYLERGAALLVSLMMVVFISAILYSAYRGLDIACGCFSLAANEPSNVMVSTVRNLLILAAGLWVLVFPRRWGRLQPAR